MKTQTHGTHQSTYDALFQHPVARNLEWRHVRTLLESLADAGQTASGKLKFTRNGRTLTLTPPQGKEVSDVDEVMRIRHFLKESETPQPKAAAGAADYLVVIDHREARIFKNNTHGSVPKRVIPHDPQHAHVHLHNVEKFADGQRKPELKAFYEEIAQEIKDAGTILIFGEATGASSAMEYLVADLKKNYPALAARVVGTVVVNEKHMSDDQLLAEARAFHGNRGS